MQDYNQLNNKQKEAVTIGEGPVLVVAGAGSGKTKVLTSRFQYLVENWNLDPDQILAITFTNKAANEMKERLKKAINNNFKWVGTFHSICLKILREDIDKINRKKDFNIIDDDDQMSIFKEAYKIYGIESKDTPFKQIYNLLDKYKRHSLTFEDLKNEKSWDFLNIKNLRDCLNKINVIKYYEKFCLENNLLDFNDLLILSNKVMQVEDVRKKWSNKFKYILVDEFQDTNMEQYELIKSLLNKENNLFVVGDPDQMIYTWRGAEHAIINNFNKDFNQCKTIILDINYRSCQEILDASNNLISFNKNRIEKSLVSHFGYSNIKPFYYEADNQDDESRWVASKIKELLDSSINPNQIAILYRSNYLSRNIEHALIQAGIKYKMFGGLKFYQRKEIKDIISYLKALYFADELSIKRIINTPRRGVSLQTTEAISKYAQNNNITFARALFASENIEGLTRVGQNGVKDFIEFILSINIKRKLVDVFDEIIEKTKYIDYLKANEEDYKIQNIEELRASILKYENEHPTCSFVDYLQDISLMTDNDDKYENAISLMTVHVSKGLEFDNVFIIGMNEDIFPSKQSIKTLDGIDEERRIAYVAMTRAKNNLYMCSHGGVNYMYNTFNKPSRFISEISSSLYTKIMPKIKSINKSFNDDWYDSTATPTININQVYSNQKIDYKIGDRIIHSSFGMGMIININNNELTIYFDSIKTKKTIMANHTSIKRILN